MVHVIPTLDVNKLRQDTIICTVILLNQEPIFGKHFLPNSVGAGLENELYSNLTHSECTARGQPSTNIATFHRLR